MKIQSLFTIPATGKLSPLSPLSATLDHQKLTKLWPTLPVIDSMQHALQQLTQHDPRHELMVKPENSVLLTTWLQQQFEALMTLHADSTGLGKAVCASMWHKQLVELVMPTLVALRFQYGLVPTKGLLEIGLDIESNGRINTISIPESALESRNDSVLDSALKAVIEQFAQTLMPIFAEQRVNQKRFWGNLSNALAQGFTRLQAEDGSQWTQSDCKQINLWLASVLPPEAHLVEVKLAHSERSSLFYVRRKTCCLKYKLDKVRMCQTCSLKDVVEQDNFYKNKLCA